MTITLGANALAQFVRFIISIACGIPSGVVALLYFRKSGKIEQALTDFFATAVIGAVFAVVIEFIFGGKFELYAAVAYLLGVIIVPLIFKAIIRHKKGR